MGSAHGCQYPLFAGAASGVHVCRSCVVRAVARIRTRDYSLGGSDDFCFTTAALVQGVIHGRLVRNDWPEISSGTTAPCGLS